MSARHYVIHGRVQGVAFRLFTRRLALREGVRGWVRNLPDGTVEAVAAADDAALERFRDGLEAGPRLSRVDRIEERAADLEAVKEVSFEIRP